MSVSKTQLIAELASVHLLGKAKAGDIVDCLLDTIAGHAAKGEKVIIQGFGTFAMKTRAARMGRNPQTGLPVEIPASTTLTFKAAKPKA